MPFVKLYPKIFFAIHNIFMVIYGDKILNKTLTFCYIKGNIKILGIKKKQNYKKIICKIHKKIIKK